MKPLKNTPDGEPMKAGKQSVFQARKRQADGKMGVGDIVLQIATTLLFELPSEIESGARNLNFTVRVPNEAVFLTAVALYKAICNKHLSSINSHGARKDVRATARDLIIDTLSNKEDWRLYGGIFAAFAERNDRDFFEQVVRGVQRGRKPVFSVAELTCILNWHEWNGRFFDIMPANIPPLKHWTDEAALNLFIGAASTSGIELKLNLSGFRTMRTRLGLEQAKPARVTGCLPAREPAGTFKIETVD